MQINSWPCISILNWRYIILENHWSLQLRVYITWSQCTRNWSCSGSWQRHLRVHVRRGHDLLGLNYLVALLHFLQISFPYTLGSHRPLPTLIHLLLEVKQVDFRVLSDKVLIHFNILTKLVRGLHHTIRTICWYRPSKIRHLESI